jgi:DNA-binding response OmpR family regulator
VRIGALELDVRGRRARLDGRELDLTPKEFDLLALLAREPGAVVSRSEILQEVWQTTWYGSAKTIDVHVASLRKKLGDPSWIETVRGIGLRLHVPDG